MVEASIKYEDVAGFANGMHHFWARGGGCASYFRFRKPRHVAGLVAGRDNCVQNDNR